MSGPPPLARLLLRLFLKGDAHEAIAGDVEEEFQRSTRAGRPDRRAYWASTLASIASRWRAPGAGAARAPAANSASWGLVRRILHDGRFGARLLSRRPGFTLAAGLTLALGISASTAIFSLAHALLVRPLPYADSDRVAFALGWDTQRDRMRFNMRLSDFVSLSEQAQSFEQMEAYQYWSASLSGPEWPERVQAYRVTAGTFAMLGRVAALGRGFRPEDGRPGASRVAVLSHGLWERRFGSDPDLVGEIVRLDGEPHEVVGVMPPEFAFPVFNFTGDIWTALQVAAMTAHDSPEASQRVVAVGRLARGASVSSTQTEMTALTERLEADFPDRYAGFGVKVVVMQEMLAERIRPAILALFAAVAFVLLIACANVANLLLARGVARERELAIRAALGAGRRRLLLQLLTESVILAAAGGVFGILLAWLEMRALVASLPDLVIQTMPGIANVGLDQATLAFTLILSVLSGILFGVVPALQVLGRDLNGRLKDGGRTAGAPASRRFRHGLVITEVAAALVLLVCAGLMIRSFRALVRVDPGFDSKGVLALSVSLPEQRYPDPRSAGPFYAELLDRVAGLRGVESAAAVNVLPFSTANSRARFVVEGAEPVEAAAIPEADLRITSPDYLATLRIPLETGRSFSRRDGSAAPAVAIVNRTLARRHFGAESPLGRRIGLAGSGAPGAWREIVGVIGEVHHEDLSGQPEAELYLPLAQSPRRSMTLALRTEAAPEALTPEVRRAIAALDPELPVYAVTTLDRLVATSLLPQSATAGLLSILGLVALALTTVGVYGVVAYSVSQRTREIGVRMALGAGRGDVIGLVLRGGLSLGLIGVGLGCAVAAGATRLLESLLYGVAPGDIAAQATGAALLLLATLLASLIPARRALGVDPLVALRDE